VPLIPSMEPLTQRCKAAIVGLGGGFANAWQAMERECSKCNIEAILSRLHSKLDAIGDGERLLGLTKEELSQMEGMIRKTIGAAVMVREDTLPQNLPHDQFALWIRKLARTSPVEVFTTNYDILFERSLERAHIPFYDGFVGSYEPFFCADSLAREELLPNAKWTRLWKIHGSVNWRLVKRGGRAIVVRAQPSGEGEMILPSHRKYDESRKQPYTALMERLSDVLSHDHAMLITCGYGFGDAHINAILFGVLDNRSTANIIALSHEELPAEHQLVKWGTERANFMVLGPNGGVIGGRWGTWELLNPVDEHTHSFMDIAFDSEACRPDSTTPSAQEGRLGRMRLGDFNCLCRFLCRMDGKH
jgi:hypothetical protein